MNGKRVTRRACHTRNSPSCNVNRFARSLAALACELRSPSGDNNDHTDPFWTPWTSIMAPFGSLGAAFCLVNRSARSLAALACELRSPSGDNNDHNDPFWTPWISIMPPFGSWGSILPPFWSSLASIWPPWGRLGRVARNIHEFPGFWFPFWLRFGTILAPKTAIFRVKNCIDFFIDFWSHVGSMLAHLSPSCDAISR